MPDRETFFITGFPGFIANRLLERLARKDCDFILLVQPSLVSHALEEIERINQLSDRTMADFQIVEGDISQPRLALSDVDLELVQQETTRVFHLAAAVGVKYVLENPLRSLLTNIRGTEVVLEACAEHKRRVLLFSSAISILTAALFGVLPAARAARSRGLVASLKSREQRSGGGSGKRSLGALVIAEIGVATTLATRMS